MFQSPLLTTCLSVLSTNRERVPLCSMEESRAEIHELGDHRALLQFQRYTTAIFVLFTKSMTEVRSYYSSWINLWHTGSVFNNIFPESGEVKCRSLTDSCWMLCLLLTDHRCWKEDERRPLGGFSHPSSHQSRPLRSDTCYSCMLCVTLTSLWLWHGHISRHY